MLIACPSCATSFTLAPAALGTAGRTVRCARCRTVWFASAEPVAEALSEHLVEAAAEADYDTAQDPLAREPITAPVDENVAPDVALPPVDAVSTDDGDDATEESSEAATEADADIEFASAGDTDSPISQTSEVMATDTLAAAEVPPLAPIADDISPLAVSPPAEIEIGEDIETVAARRAHSEALRHRRLALMGLPGLAAALLAIDVGLIAWRTEVVRIIPQTASLFAAIGLPVNLRGLSLANVGTTKDVHDGIPVLVVEGSIVATGRSPAEVPRLRFAVRNAKGQEIYTWTAAPARGVLGAGETQTFRSRLASPPAETRDVVVRFVNRYDMIARAQ
jgi:predicted Zn finger-like uncharacterized protein